jgi:hypothetical protein
MTNFLVRGTYNLPIDRFYTLLLEAVAPSVTDLQMQNEEFSQRVAQELVDRGIRQIIDIGGGAHTHYPVHQVARLNAPESRVLYTYNQQSVVNYTRQQLVEESSVSTGPIARLGRYGMANRQGRFPVDVVLASLWDPQSITRAAETQRLIDFSEPVAVIIREEQNYIADDSHLRRIFSELTSTMASGSYLVMIMATDEGVTDLVRHQLDVIYQDQPMKLTLRPRKRTLGLLSDLVIVEDPPGIVDTVQWGNKHPAPVGAFRAHAVVGRVP